MRFSLSFIPIAIAFVNCINVKETEYDKHIIGLDFIIGNKNLKRHKL